MSKNINMAVIGLGCRGISWLSMELLKIENVRITAVCDVYEDRVNEAQELVKKEKGFTPFGTLDYREILPREDVDVVLIITSWETHTEIAVASMEAGKFTAMEVGGAYSVQDCWELVDTYERTKTPFMFMENCCYGEYEMMVMNMARRGLLGEIVHCEGGYQHDLRDEVAGGEENRHYRLRNYLARNCENYPTHELGPIAKILGINRGNRFVSLCSFASGSKGMAEYIKDRRPPNEKLRTAKFSQADIVKTFIKCENGETICITLDTTLPRFYSRGFTVRGTKGMYSEDCNMVFLDKVHEKYDFNPKALWDNAKDYRGEYANPLWAEPEKLYGGGHGGMDYVLINALLDCVEKGNLPPIDVYDAAAWMAVTALSEESIKNGGKVMETPDFTRGKYKDRQDHNLGDYSLEK